MDGQANGQGVPDEYARQYWAWVDEELQADWGAPLGSEPGAEGVER